MSDGVTTVERLRQFLRGLKPEARSLLIAELERGLLRGDDVAGADLILQELRRIIRDQREGAPRVGNSARLFFMPVEPFIVDDDGAHKHPGRLARTALEPLWTWLKRDLLPDEAKQLGDEVAEALLASDESRATQLTLAFQDRAWQAIERTLEGAAGSEPMTRRLKSQIATRKPVEDARALMHILRSRDSLDVLDKNLPVHIADLSGDRLARTKEWIDTAAAHNVDIRVYALLLVMNKLAAPWQIIRLATRAAGSDTATRVGGTAYAVAVDIVLAELERLVGELKADLQRGNGVAVGALLKVIHDCVRGLRTELELPADHPWGRQLAALRGQISDLLKSEIEAMPGRVRRLLRPRPSTEIRANSTLDPSEVAETEALIEFVGHCRHFAGELALNEITQRTFTDVQQYLDSGTRTLLDGLRHAGEADRAFRQSQVDAAIRFSGKMFGKDYAGMLTKAAGLASVTDRKRAS